MGQRSGCARAGGRCLWPLAVERPPPRGPGGRASGQALGLCGHGSPEPARPSRGVAGEAPGAAARPVSTWRRSDGRVSCPVAGLRERGREFILSRQGDLSGASSSRLFGSGDSGRSVGQRPKWTRTVPQPLLPGGECLMCKLPSQGSWLPNPPPDSGLLCSHFRCVRWTPQTVPPPPGRMLKCDNKACSVMMLSS